MNEFLHINYLLSNKVIIRLSVFLISNYPVHIFYTFILKKTIYYSS